MYANIDTNIRLSVRETGEIGDTIVARIYIHM